MIDDQWHGLKANIPCIPTLLKDVKDVARWGSSPGKTAMQRQAAAFLVAVWTGECATKFQEGNLPAFDAIAIAAMADDSFRIAISRWILSPFWPEGGAL